MGVEQRLRSAQRGCAGSSGSGTDITLLCENWGGLRTFRPQAQGIWFLYDVQGNSLMSRGRTMFRQDDAVIVGVRLRVDAWDRLDAVGA